MADPIFWSNVGVDVQTSLASALTITAISKASTGVVSYTGTDPTNGDYVLIAQPGCRPLENDVLRAQFLQLLARARSLKASAPPGTMPASPVGVERPAPES